MKTLIVIGTGALAREVVCSLAVLDHPALRLVVVGRDSTRASVIAHLASVRASAVRHSGRLATTSIAIDPLSMADHAWLVENYRPDCVLVCASLQSPWEKDLIPSLWTKILAESGAAAALPLQAAIVRRAAAAAPPLLVNACYPDMVNPLLAALGTPAFCGIGNVALIAASIRSALALNQAAPLKVIAHHWHLGAETAPADDARVYVDDVAIGEVSALLDGQRAVPRPMLNGITGLISAQLLVSLLSGVSVRANLPGPQGLPGGYPVHIQNGGLDIDLPPELTLEDAITLNHGWAELSGAWMKDGYVHFGQSASIALAPHSRKFSDGFAVDELPEVEAAMIELQHRLRGRS